MRPVQPSRRRFLGSVSAGIAATRLWSELSAQGHPQTSPEAYWSGVREQFSFREDNVPMNAANLCPSPRIVFNRVRDLTEDVNRDCSFNNRAKFQQLTERSREGVARHLGVSADEIALVRNTSEANNTINRGLRLKPRDEVLLWDQNHPTNNVAWAVRAQRFGFQVKHVSVPGKPQSESDLIDPFVSQFTDRTRALAVTHVSNLSGIRLPVSRLAGLARRRGIHVHVDGAQSWGALNVDLKELNCDSYAASAHKWATGPLEAGILWVRGERIQKIWASVIAPGWGGDVETVLQGARKFESLGQRDDACLAAVGTAMDFQAGIGAERIEARVLELAGYLKEGLVEIGASLVTPEQEAFSAGVVIIQVPGENRQKIVDTLYQDFGIAAAPTGGLRFSPHFYNTRAHLDRALEGVKSCRELLA